MQLAWGFVTLQLLHCHHPATFKGEGEVHQRFSELMNLTRSHHEEELL